MFLVNRGFDQAAGHKTLVPQLVAALRPDELKTSREYVAGRDPPGFMKVSLMPMAFSAIYGPGTISVCCG